MPTERKSEPKPHLRPRPFRLKVHGWLRWAHTYISMFSLLAILFFSLTGVTLNHPDWAFTNSKSEKVVKGQLPKDWKKGKEVDWFVVTEHLRKTDGAKGAVTAKEADDSEGSISFAAPGYSADGFIEVDSGKYELTVTNQGIAGMMNEFHRGSNAGGAWKFLIDLSGVTLAIIALTGLGLIWFLKKIRTAGFIVVGVGALIVFIAMRLAF